MFPEWDLCVEHFMNLTFRGQSDVGDVHAVSVLLAVLVVPVDLAPDFLVEVTPGDLAVLCPDLVAAPGGGLPGPVHDPDRFKSLSCFI